MYAFVSVSTILVPEESALAKALPIPKEPVATIAKASVFSSATTLRSPPLVEVSLIPLNSESFTLHSQHGVFTNQYLELQYRSQNSEKRKYM